MEETQSNNDQLADNEKGGITEKTGSAIPGQVAVDRILSEMKKGKEKEAISGSDTKGTRSDSHVK